MIFNDKCMPCFMFQFNNLDEDNDYAATVDNDSDFDNVVYHPD